MKQPSRRQMRIEAARREMAMPVTDFYQLDLGEASFIPDGMTRAFRNTRYTVMIFDKTPTNQGTCIKALVQRHDDAPIPNHWSEMQKIKNEIFGDETTAVEFYPPKSKLVDQHNIYWLWIFPDGQLPIPLMNL